MANQNAPDNEPRFLLYHLHPVSARLQFMRHASGSIFTTRALSFLSSPIEDDQEFPEMGLEAQIALGLALNADLGFEAAMLVVDRHFRRQAEIPRARVDLYLARLTPLDPPGDTIRTHGGELCSISDFHGLHPVEMTMLRWAFDYLIGG